ncbi:MAG: ATP synthase F1 subunit gamma [Deltaproteobacteria bacterium]|nr:ATP synthase F1 subunit gamma [Deltaproteobacteria bacterium]
MASLRDIRNRIGSVKNTRQITRAMKLVSSAKLNRATQAATSARPYQQALERTLQRVVGAVGGAVEHPLLRLPNNENDVLVVVMTADRGLCGNFNSIINRAAQLKVEELVAAGKNVRIYCYGKKGRQHLARRGFTVADSVVDLNPKAYPAIADELSLRLQRELAEDAFSEVFLAYNRYRSVLSQEPTVERILPMQLEVPATPEGEVAEGVDFLFEPDASSLLARLLPMSLRTRLFQALLETQAGEQAKRMTAMDAATRNASELINRLTLEYNRARQAAITKELIEIVSGAEAL